MPYTITHSCTMDGPQFLQALLDLRGLNPNSMAKKAGNHALQSTVARFLGGNQSRRSTMQPVADFFGVDVGGFYDPDKAVMELRRLGAMEGPMHEGAGEAALTIRAPGLTPAPAPGAPAITVPLLANAGSMGPGTEIQHDDVLVGHIALSEQWVARRLQPSSHGALRFIHAYGDSMAPTFEDGDVLLVDTGMRDPRAIDGVYVMAANDRVYIKRVRQRMDGVVEISSDNATVKTVDVLNGDHRIDILGRVIWAWNGRKL